VIKHETLESGSHLKTNTAFCCHTIKDPKHGDVFLVGAEDKHITKYSFDSRDLELAKLGSYMGHSNSVRAVDTSKSNKHMLSSCEDHSLRVWDYETYEPLLILSGHKDNVVSKISNAINV